MKLVLKELVNESVIIDRSLRKRARECARISFTKHYIVYSDDREVAYLAVDQIPGADYILLYEIFIREEYRKKGIGSQILDRVEALGKEMGYNKVVLHVESFDRKVSKETIESWYRKRGYRTSEKLHKALEKEL